MKTKGRRTIVENLDVEVDVLSFLEKIYDESIPRGLKYLNDNGYWYKVDGYDYHKNEDLYEKDREATQEEIELKKAYYTLRKFVKENGL